MPNTVLISDFGVPQEVLDHNVGAFKVGGAEQHDGALVYYLKDMRGLDVAVWKCSEVNPGMINLEDRYIISNYTGLSPAVKEQLQVFGNYLIYEHDHQYCANRNPFMFPDMLVPIQAQMNIPFYACAAGVVCMTSKHESVLRRNVDVKKSCNIGGTFYYQEELDFMQELLHKKKNNKLRLKKPEIAAVYGHPHPLKGLHNSVRYCHKHDIPFEVMVSKPTKKEFLEEMATFSRIVFLPLQPETCCRIVVEALMLGLNVQTAGIVGATGEPWFNLKPEEIITELGLPLRERAMSCIVDTLLTVKDVSHSNT